MCGHGTIGTVTVAVERGLVTPREEGLLRLDTPAGLVEARYKRDGEHVDSVRLTNVPGYLHAEGVTIDCPGLGELAFDISYGGNFYAILEPQKNYRDMADFSPGEILRLSPIMRRLLNEAIDCVHPENPTITRRQPYPVDRQGQEPEGPCPQRRLLWREGHRPQPLRHRHLGPHGPARRPGQARGRRRVHP